MRYYRVCRTALHYTVVMHCTSRGYASVPAVGANCTRSVIRHPGRAPRPHTHHAAEIGKTVVLPIVDFVHYFVPLLSPKISGPATYQSKVSIHPHLPSRRKNSQTKLLRLCTLCITCYLSINFIQACRSKPKKYIRDLY